MTDRERTDGRKHDEDRANTGAGAEAAEGIHSSEGREQEEDLPGSEPLRHRDTEHKSGYGGEGAEPKTSSDQR